MDVGSSLRAARERRRLTIADISKRTKIKSELLVGLENNDLSQWPRHRVYRHGYLRSYAQAVGMDPTLVLEQFDTEFGDPYPAPFHGRQGTIEKTGVATSTVLASALAMIVGAGVVVTLLNARRASMVDVPETTASRPESDVAVAVQPVSIATHSTVAPTTGSDEPVASDLPASDVGTADLMTEDVEGELRIVSKPDGAHVTVNGIGRGETPVRIRYLPLGSYTIRVVQPGYMISQTIVTLRPDQPSRTVRLVLHDEPMFALNPADASSSHP